MSGGGNIATVSFKLTPAYYAVLQALAAEEGKRVSTFVRETTVQSLELKRALRMDDRVRAKRATLA